jgi:hypothetical protein
MFFGGYLFEIRRTVTMSKANFYEQIESLYEFVAIFMIEFENLFSALIVLAM